MCHDCQAKYISVLSHLSKTEEHTVVFGCLDLWNDDNNNNNNNLFRFLSWSEAFKYEETFKISNIQLKLINH